MFITKSLKICYQRDAMDCGPSCLAIIAKHYGQQADKEQLRKICSLGKKVFLFLVSARLQKTSVSRPLEDV